MKASLAAHLMIILGASIGSPAVGKYKAIYKELSWG